MNQTIKCDKCKKVVKLMPNGCHKGLGQVCPNCGQNYLIVPTNALRI
jgi:rRNA maturation endonuclease Nob1